MWFKLKYSQYYSQQSCFYAPRTKTGREYYKKQILKNYHIEDESKVEFVCPEIDKEINGFCTEYSSAMLDKPSDCFGLSLENLKGQVDDISAYACCSVINKKETGEYTHPLPTNINVCLPLLKYKASRDEYLKKWISSLNENYGKSSPFDLDYLTIDCGN